jgi:hypothetical protein
VKSLVAWVVCFAAFGADAAVVRGRVAGGRAVVLLESDAPAQGARTVRLHAAGDYFVPRVQIAPLGSTLVVRNDDGWLHNAHGRTHVGTIFNRPTIPSAEAQRLLLSRVGLVTITCDIHSGMHAYVVVTRAPYAARTLADGTFELRGVAKGSYRVRVWRVPAGVAFTDTGREVGDVVKTIGVSKDTVLDLP